MKYYALIADISDSRDINYRYGFQKELEEILYHVSSVVHNEDRLVSPYTITLGDEFQALYAKADRIIEDVLYIMSHVSPVRIRFAVGYGSILTPLKRQTALGMDGSAFHHAREGIDKMKKSKINRIHFYGYDSPCIAVVNKSLEYVFREIDRFNVNAWKILYELYIGESVETISEKIDISKRAIYKNIESKNLHYLSDYLNSVGEAL